MNKLFVIRHTQPDVASGLCYGRSDVPYRKEPFQNWASPIILPPLFRAYSSPSKRCHDLSLRVSRSPVCIDERLMELDFGDWEGRLWNDITREESAPWMNDYFHEAPPSGETLRAMIQRVQSFVTDLAGEEKKEKEKGGGDAAIFTHAGVIRILLIASHGETVSEYFKRQVDYGSVFLLPRWPKPADFERLLSINDSL